MESTRKKLIGSAIAATLVLGVGSSRANAAGDAWLDAIGQCAPGNKLDDCIAQLKKAGLTPEVSKNAGHRSATVDLKDPYVWVSFDTYERLPKAQGRIVQTQFTAKLPAAKKDRHQWVSWLAEHLKGAKTGAAVDGGSGSGCGAAESGPAWGADPDSPEVQLALATVSWLKPPAGKSPTTRFETGKSDQLSVCFMLPLTESKDDYVAPQYTSVYGEFVKSPLFAQKTEPAPAKP